MKTLREKITFAATALAYLVFHLRLGADPWISLMATLRQLLLTAPYAVGFTYLITLFIRYATGGIWPPRDRIARIYFTLGILFAFFFALYEYGGGDVMKLL